MIPENIQKQNIEAITQFNADKNKIAAGNWKGFGNKSILVVVGKGIDQHLELKKNLSFFQRLRHFLFGQTNKQKIIKQIDASGYSTIKTQKNIDKFYEKTHSIETISLEDALYRTHNRDKKEDTEINQENDTSQQAHTPYNEQELTDLFRKQYESKK